MPVASSSIAHNKQHLSGPISRICLATHLPSPHYHDFCKCRAKPPCSLMQFYRVLPWQYSLPPADGQGLGPRRSTMQVWCSNCRYHVNCGHGHTTAHTFFINQNCMATSWQKTNKSHIIWL
jgi:hypothetical protein